MLRQQQQEEEGAPEQTVLRPRLVSRVRLCVRATRTGTGSDWRQQGRRTQPLTHQEDDEDGGADEDPVIEPVFVRTALCAACEIDHDYGI